MIAAGESGGPSLVPELRRGVGIPRPVGRAHLRQQKAEIHDGQHDAGRGPEMELGPDFRTVDTTETCRDDGIRRQHTA